MRYCKLLLFSLCISALAIWCGMNDLIAPKEHLTSPEKVTSNLQLLSDDEHFSDENNLSCNQASLEEQEQSERELFEHAELWKPKLATLQEYVQLEQSTNTTTLIQNFATRSAFTSVAKSQLLRSRKNNLSDLSGSKFNDGKYHETNLEEQEQQTAQGKYVVVQFTPSHLNKMTYLQNKQELLVHVTTASQIANGAITRGVFNSIAIMLQEMENTTHHMVKDEDVHVLDDQHYLIYMTPSSALSFEKGEAATYHTITTHTIIGEKERESNNTTNSSQPGNSPQVENAHQYHQLHPIHVLDVFRTPSTSLLKLSVRLRSYLHTRLAFSDFVLKSNTSSKTNKVKRNVNTNHESESEKSNVLQAEKREEQTLFINFTTLPEWKLSYGEVEEYSESNAEMLELMVMTAHGMASEVVRTLRNALQNNNTHNRRHENSFALPSRLDEFKSCNVSFYTQQEMRQMREPAHVESTLQDDYFILRIILDTNNYSNSSRNGVEKYKCLGLVNAIAVHPAIRWIEHSARSPFVLNEVAASGIQGGYVVRNSTYSSLSSSSSTFNEANYQFKTCETNNNYSIMSTNNERDSDFYGNELTTSNNYFATNLHPLWSMGINGSNEIILIADSGVDYTSCYFADDKEEISLYPKVSHTHRKIISYHGCARNGEVKPNIGDQVNGHGTHVAGSALGATFYQSQLKSKLNECNLNEKINGTSSSSSASSVTPTNEKCSFNTQVAFSSNDMSRYNGVAFAAKMFMEHMTCGGEKAGYVTIPGVLEDLYYPGYYAGARVGCNSWGFYPDMSYSALEKIIDRIVYDHDDLLLLFASGNNANWGTHIPGTAKNVLTVGSHVNSASATEQNVIATTSSWGKVYDLRIKPELVGPGGLSVISARSSGRKELHRLNKNMENKEMVHGVQNESVCNMKKTYRESVLLDEQLDEIMNKSTEHISCNKNNNNKLFSNLEEQAKEEEEQDCKRTQEHEYKQPLENTTRLSSDNECSVVRKTGTSMANGVTTGAAALIRQYLREWHHIASPSTSLLKAALIHSTVYLAKEVKRAGFGRVDLSLLPATPIEWVKEIRTQSVNDDHTQNKTFLENKSATEQQIVHLQNWVADREVVTHHSYNEYYFTATSLFDDNTKFMWKQNSSEIEEQHHQQQQQQSAQTWKKASQVNMSDSPVIDVRQEARLIKVTLVWTDLAAAVEGTTKSLINDLDLMVVDVWGHMYYSNTHMSEASKKNDGKFDRTNNVEQVRLELSANLAQEFRVIVYGNKVITNHGQQYSLVVSAPGLHYVKIISPHVKRSTQLVETNYQNNEEKGKDDTLKSVSRYCANNCSHHGTCDVDSLTCTCSAQYRFVDCSLCNEEVVCSGHGSCNDKTLKCTCDPHSHFVDQLSFMTSNSSTVEDTPVKYMKEDDDDHEIKSVQETTACSVCQTGWYGPWCNSRCECNNGGICNTTTGECMCVQNKRNNTAFSSSVSSRSSLTKPEKVVENVHSSVRRQGPEIQEQQRSTYNKIGIMIEEKTDNNVKILEPVNQSCFDGDSCQYCCPGYGGEQCDEVSYWCDTSGKMVNITHDNQGWIEINSYHTYPHSIRCNWRLVAPRFHRIVLEFVEVKLEYGFDTISVYDVKRNRTINNNNIAGNYLVGLNEPTELVRRYTGELWHIPPYTSKSNTLALQFVSDWGPVNEGFKIHYEFVEEQQCNITCTLPNKQQRSMQTFHKGQMPNLSAEHNALLNNEEFIMVEPLNYTYTKEETWSNAEDMSEVVTCGSVLELPNWCICIPPYFGINCELRSDQSYVSTVAEAVVRRNVTNPVNNDVNKPSRINKTLHQTLESMVFNEEDIYIVLSALQRPAIEWAVAESTLSVLELNTTHEPIIYTRLKLMINGLSVLHVIYDMHCTTPEHNVGESHVLELTFIRQIDKLMRKNHKDTNSQKIQKYENVNVEDNVEHHEKEFARITNSKVLREVMESLTLSVSRVVVAEDEMEESTFAHTQLLPLTASFDKELHENESTYPVNSCSLNSETGQVVFSVQIPVPAMECHNNSTNHSDLDNQYDATFALMLLWNASRKVSLSSELLSVIEKQGVDVVAHAKWKGSDKVYIASSRSQVGKEEKEKNLQTEKLSSEEEWWYDEYDFNLTCIADNNTNENNNEKAQVYLGQSEQVPEWLLFEINDSQHGIIRKHFTSVTQKIAILCIVLSGVLGLLLGQLMALSLQRGWWCSHIKCLCCGEAESNVYDTVEVTWHSEDVMNNNNHNRNNIHGDIRSMREYDTYLQRAFSNDGSNHINNIIPTPINNNGDNVVVVVKHSNTKLGRGKDEANEGIEMELLTSSEANNVEVQEATNKSSAAGAVEKEETTEPATSV